MRIHHFSKPKAVRERKSPENTDIEPSSVSTSHYRFFAVLCCHVYQLPYTRIVKRRMRFCRIKYLFMIELRIGESILANSVSLIVF